MNIDMLVEIELKYDEDFLKIKETLTRIGIASKKENILYQSCHILHKQGRYYIVHFKQLFGLDGKDIDFSEEDRGRLHTIIALLEEWSLLRVVRPDQIREPREPISSIKILPWKEKSEWKLVQKYSMGTKGKAS